LSVLPAGRVRTSGHTDPVKNIRTPRWPPRQHTRRWSFLGPGCLCRRTHRLGPYSHRRPGAGRHLGRARFDRARWGRLPRKDVYRCYCCGDQVWPV